MSEVKVINGREVRIVDTLEVIEASQTLSNLLFKQLDKQQEALNEIRSILETYTHYLEDALDDLEEDK